MRIIAGKYRGKKLFTPSNLNVRPTAERAREALFSILYSKFGSLEERRVLDVFAGTGAFGFEAVSRGARAATFIDIDPVIVKKNMQLFEQEKHKFSVVKANALKLPQARQSYNLLFMDAPYQKNLTEPAIAELVEKRWLADGAVCLIETEKNESVVLPAGFELLETRIYGIAKIGICIFKENV